MQITLPDYFSEFECIADQCPDTCCAGWAIMIDKRSLKKYKKMKGPFGNRMKNSVDWKEGCFERYNNRCVFLNEENLCDLYLEAGPEALCRTCRNYPRHIEEFEGLREISLSFSCPVVAKLMMENRDLVKFLSFDEEGKEEEYEDFDFLLFTKLSDARSLMFRILQNRAIPIRVRMGMTLALAHDLQIRIRENRLFDADELFARYEKENAAIRFEKRMEECVGRQVDSVKLLSLLDSMEVLKADWPEFLKKAKEGSRKRKMDDIQYEQLMVYFLYTYFCGALYDERAYAKAKLAFASTNIIAELYARTEESIPLWEVVYRYCREIEHSDDNLRAMEKELQAVRMQELLGIL